MVFCHWQFGYLSFPKTYHFIHIFLLDLTGLIFQHLLTVLNIRTKNKTQYEIRLRTLQNIKKKKSTREIRSGWHGGQTIDKWKVKIWPRNDYPVMSALMTKVFKKLETCHFGSVSYIQEHLKISWAAIRKTWLEWPSSKSIQIVNGREGVEKREPSYSVRRNVNWYNHYGE